MDYLKTQRAFEGNPDKNETYSRQHFVFQEKRSNRKRKTAVKEEFMREALRLAYKAKKKGEVPIGAVVVLNDKIVGRGYNLRTRLQMATAHAEVRAIDRACKKIKSWRLQGAEIYVTLEPCPMCMGAILNARIDRVYFGAYEQKGRSLTRELANANLLNHTTEVTGGVLEAECSEVLSSFFSEMRLKEKEKKKK